MKQKIKYDNKGAYMTYQGKRIYLYEVIKSNSGDDIARVYHHSADSPYRVHLLGFDADGDAVGMVEFIG